MNAGLYCALFVVPGLIKHFLYRQLPDGSEPTIEWLVRQATERYYTQESVRPELTLTTLDGALLGISDAIQHVLGPNEEVVGVVKQWILPPLPERYEVACKSRQKGTLSVFVL